MGQLKPQTLVFSRFRRWNLRGGLVSPEASWHSQGISSVGTHQVSSLDVQTLLLVETLVRSDEGPF